MVSGLPRLEITGNSIFDSHHFLVESHLYLVWNFGASTTWCLEVTLTVLVPAEKGGSWLGSYLVWLELLLSIYFATDSILLFRQWQKTGNWKSELVVTILSTLGYLYYCLKPRACQRSGVNGANEQEE